MTITFKNGLTATMEKGVWKSSSADLALLLNQLTTMITADLSPADGSPMITAYNTILKKFATLLRPTKPMKAVTPTSPVLY